jgi:hypothetical protein
MYVQLEDVSDEFCSGVLGSGIEENANFVRRVTLSID